MKFLNIKICTLLALLLLLLTVFGCNKPESKLVGTWNNVKTPSSIQFNQDKTGVIFQRTNPQLPQQILFKWAMLKDNDFIVEVLVQGNVSPPQAHGTLKEDDTIVLDNDTFKKVK